MLTLAKRLRKDHALSVALWESKGARDERHFVKKGVNWALRELASPKVRSRLARRAQ